MQLSCSIVFTLSQKKTVELLVWQLFVTLKKHTEKVELYLCVPECVPECVQEFVQECVHECVPVCKCDFSESFNVSFL